MKRSIPEITVDLDQSTAERWIKPGRKIARHAHQLCNSMLEICGEYLPKALGPILTRRASTFAFLAHLPCKVLLRDLMEEAKGLSKGTGIPAPLLALANCTYDAAQYINGTEPNACSAAVYLDKEQRPAMIRYMDWAIPEDIGKYTVRVNYVRDGIPAYSSLGFAGFLGVITAMAPEWALAFNQAPASRVRKTLFGSPATYAARKACDASVTFRELKEQVANAEAFTPFLALICGKQKGEMLRIERPMQGRATFAKAPAKSPLVVTNHYIHRNHRRLNALEVWDEDAEYYTDTAERFCAVEEIAQGCSRKSRVPTFKELKRSPVFHENTVHLAVMRPATEELKVSVRL